jgi:hypothetical protein
MSSNSRAITTSAGVPAPLPSMMPIGNPPATTLSGLAAEITSRVMNPALKAPCRNSVDSPPCSLAVRWGAGTD